MTRAGLDHVEILETAGAPSVYADHLLAGPGAPWRWAALSRPCPRPNQPGSVATWWSSPTPTCGPAPNERVVMDQLGLLAAGELWAEVAALAPAGRHG
ncbi:MAG: hypothetical protein ACR2GF_04190 [Acidimicrobiales bacterium]